MIRKNGISLDGIGKNAVRHYYSHEFFVHALDECKEVFTFTLPQVVFTPPIPCPCAVNGRRAGRGGREEMFFGTP